MIFCSGYNLKGVKGMDKWINVLLFSLYYYNFPHKVDKKGEYNENKNAQYWSIKIWW